MLKYSDVVPALKMEISYLAKAISPDSVTTKDFISLYKIEILAQLKANAYLQRDKIRDVFDISFIINNYWDKLSVATQSGLTGALAHKGLDEFEYLIQQQEDHLINTDFLLEEFLKANDKAGLLNMEKPKEKTATKNDKKQKPKYKGK